MAVVKSLDGRSFEFDAATLDKYRIPDEQVKSLTGGYDLPAAPPARVSPPGPAPGAVAVPGVSVQVPPSMRDCVSVERGPGNAIVIQIGPRNA